MVKKAVDVLSTVLLILLILLTLVLFGSRLVGINNYTVLSGSMEPTYHVGSLIYVKPIDGSEVKKGDAITFVLDGTIVTHRAVEIMTDESKIVTKGDANDCNDAAIEFSAVIGKVLFSIPYLGYVAAWFASSAGKVVIIVGFVVAVVLAAISEFFLKKTMPKRVDDIDKQI